MSPGRPPPAATPPASATPAAEPLPLLAALIALTLVSGLVDAASYLGLGHVFTANMTGNVVVLGFAAAGAAGFSATATLTSLGVFLVGAVAAGRLAARITGRDRLLVTTMAAEILLVGAAALVAFLTGSTAHGWARFTVIALLALAMGMRNAAVRRLGVRDLTTTVLTLTLTGLATDSGLAGGQNPRVGAVIAMAVGAAAGAAMYLHVSIALPLLTAAAVTAATAAGYLISLRARRRRVRPGLVS